VLTKEDAKQLVFSRINEKDPYSSDNAERVVLDDATIEKEYGWVFFYQSKKYLETGKINDALAGNAPIIVNKRTGELIKTGTANPRGVYC